MSQEFGNSKSDSKKSKDNSKHENVNVIFFPARRAQRLIEQGMDDFAKGDVSGAVNSFRSSTEMYPTAEGFTYWGWMLSFQGDLDSAIDLCKKAIDLDPEFGNPYNDIGTYFMKKGELDSAIPWLERAKVALRYEPKHFPFLNLGRIYLSQGKFLTALREFEGALEFDSENTELRAVIDRIKASNYTS
jgi:Tfp pilus assembly protein PilF